jgi:hypothetical protein
VVSVRVNLNGSSISFLIEFLLQFAKVCKLQFEIFIFDRNVSVFFLILFSASFVFLDLSLKKCYFAVTSLF